jgi:hypothetical protein
MGQPLSAGMSFFVQTSAQSPRLALGELPCQANSDKVPSMGAVRLSGLLAELMSSSMHAVVRGSYRGTRAASSKQQHVATLWL